MYKVEIVGDKYMVVSGFLEFCIEYVCCIVRFFLGMMDILNYLKDLYGN